MGIRIGLLSSNNKLLDSLENYIDGFVKKKIKDQFFEIKKLNKISSAIEYLNVEFPDFIFIDYDDKKLKYQRIFSLINRDPWFYRTGFIILTNINNIKQMLNLSTTFLNLVCFLDTANLEFQLHKIFYTIFKKDSELPKDIVFDNSNRSGHFIIDNDPTIAIKYVNYIINLLIIGGEINTQKANSLRLVLNELVINAIEHGNCDIQYEEKMNFIKSGGNMSDLICQKNMDPQIAKKKVTLEYYLKPKSVIFSVKDEGKGFKLDNNLDDLVEDDTPRAYGFGIYIAKIYIPNLKYNAKGNIATLEIELDRKVRMIPIGFLNKKEIAVKEGELIIDTDRVEEQKIYYIISGRYRAIIDEKLVYEYTHQDGFIGDLFFLRGRKSGGRLSVEVVSDGELIELTRDQFIKVMSKHPYYLSFLLKSISKKLDMLNSKSLFY